MSKKVLITGGAGFIGSHLAEYLLSKSCEVKVLDQYSSMGMRGWIDTLPSDVRSGIEYIGSDIRDPFAVKGAMKGIDIVFHLAALIAIPYSYTAPQSYVETNITGTLNVLQAARDLDIDRVIHTSTSEVYGSAQYVPIDENHPLVGQSPYSASKIAADQLAISFHRSFELAVSVIRPFNTYGPRQSCRAIIPTIITQILSGTKEIKLGSLEPTRDFSFVQDTVRGFWELSQESKTIGEVINIGSGFEISIGLLAKKISEIMQADIVEITSDPQRIRPNRSEVQRLFADVSKASETFNWKPEYGGHEGFFRGLAKTVSWFQDKKNLRYYQLENRYHV